MTDRPLTVLSPPAGRECAPPEMIARRMATEPDPRYGLFSLQFNQALGALEGGATLAVLGDGAKPGGVLLAGGEGEVLDWCGLPLRPSGGEAGWPSGGRAAGAVIDDLVALAEKLGKEAVALDAGPAAPTLSPMEEKLIARGASCRVSVRGLISLQEGPDALSRALRKRYRSQVNWGRRELRLVVIDGDNPDFDRLALTEEFHAKVAGRRTRSRESWRLQFERIVAGEGVAVMAFLPDAGLVGATICIDGQGRRVYWSGVYDRARFEHPISHWPMLAAAEHGARRGLSVFDLGDIKFREDVSEKEFNIGQFKKGFASALEARRIWRLPIKR